jgi:hypothetical protein
VNSSDDEDILIRYERLGLERRRRRRGAVRGTFGAFAVNPAALPPDSREPSLLQQLARQQAEASAPSVTVPVPQDRIMDFREREQMRFAAQYLRRRSRV